MNFSLPTIFLFSIIFHSLPLLLTLFLCFCWLCNKLFFVNFFHNNKMNYILTTMFCYVLLNIIFMLQFRHFFIFLLQIVNLVKNVFDVSCFMLSIRIFFLVFKGSCCVLLIFIALGDNSCIYVYLCMSIALSYFSTPYKNVI